MAPPPLTASKASEETRRHDARAGRGAWPSPRHHKPRTAGPGATSVGDPSTRRCTDCSTPTGRPSSSAPSRRAGCRRSWCTRSRITCGVASWSTVCSAWPAPAVGMIAWSRLAARGGASVPRASGGSGQRPYNVAPGSPTLTRSDRLRHVHTAHAGQHDPRHRGISAFVLLGRLTLRDDVGRRETW